MILHNAFFNLLLALPYLIHCNEVLQSCHCHSLYVFPTLKTVYHIVFRLREVFHNFQWVHQFLFSQYLLLLSLFNCILHHFSVSLQYPPHHHFLERYWHHSKPLMLLNSSPVHFMYFFILSIVKSSAFDPMVGRYFSSLKISLSYSRLLYLLHCTPVLVTHRSKHIDAIMSGGLGHILNIYFITASGFRQYPQSGTAVCRSSSCPFLHLLPFWLLLQAPAPSSPSCWRRQAWTLILMEQKS